MLGIKDNCKCSYCSLRASVEVVGCDVAIKHEFDRIEQAAKRKVKTDTQTKTPSVGADGV